jgi:2-haloacid dehalogenase
VTIRYNRVMGRRSIAIFDLGGVLVDWNPRYLYRKLFRGNEAEMEHFLANVCTSKWNLQQDAGRSFAEATALLKKEHPNYSELIEAWFVRHPEMLAGPIPGSVGILAELRANEVPLYALSNWSTETFPSAQKRFDFLQWFKGILLSGKVGLVKPDPRIYELFLATFGIDPIQAVYIDDIPANVEGANAVGMHGIVFKNAEQLRTDLTNLGLMDHAVKSTHTQITPTQSSPEASR